MAGLSTQECLSRQNIKQFYKIITKDDIIGKLKSIGIANKQDKMWLIIYHI